MSFEQKLEWVARFLIILIPFIFVVVLAVAGIIGYAVQIKRLFRSLFRLWKKGRIKSRRKRCHRHREKKLDEAFRKSIEHGLG